MENIFWPSSIGDFGTKPKRPSTPLPTAPIPHLLGKQSPWNILFFTLFSYYSILLIHSLLIVYCFLGVNHFGNVPIYIFSFGKSDLLKGLYETRVLFLCDYIVSDCLYYILRRTGKLLFIVTTSIDPFYLGYIIWDILSNGH